MLSVPHKESGQAVLMVLERCITNISLKLMAP